MKRSCTRWTALVATAVTSAVLVAGCSSSSPDRKDSATNSPTTQSSTTTTGGQPTNGAGSTAPSGTGSGSSGSGASPTAPYPTPGHEPDAQTNQVTVLNSLPGSSAGSCAVVGSHTDLRAGSVAAGNFATAKKQYASTVGKTEVPSVSLYVIPQNAKAMDSVTITVDPRGAGVTKKVTSKSIGQADAWSFYAVTLPVPAAGSYRLTVVAGINHGCFDVTFAP